MRERNEDRRMRGGAMEKRGAEASKLSAEDRISSFALHRPINHNLQSETRISDLPPRCRARVLALRARREVPRSAGGPHAASNTMRNRPLRDSYYPFLFFELFRLASLSFSTEYLRNPISRHERARARVHAAVARASALVARLFEEYGLYTISM